MSEVLDDATRSAELAGLPDWTYDPQANALVRTATLPSFPDAIAVVDRVAEAAERHDHHPDIDIRWRTLTFRCATHSAGGVTARDVALAGEISRLVAAAQQR